MYVTSRVQAIVCGQQSAAAEDIIKALRFSAFRRGSQTPDHLKALLRSWVRIALCSGLTSASARVPQDSSDSCVSLLRALVPSPGCSQSEAERKRFLVFVTAQSALPASDSHVKIARHGRPSDYPTAHTCFNRLDLPDYNNAEKLRRCLTFCIENIELAGFGIA